MKKTLLLITLLALGSLASHAAKNENAEPKHVEPEHPGLSMLSIYTANVDGSNIAGSDGKKLSVAVVRQIPNKAALYRCTKVFLGSTDDSSEILNFFSNNCLHYNVQKNYLTNREGNRIRVVFSGAGSHLYPSSGELFSDVMTYTADLHYGSGVRKNGTVNFIGSRITHYEREAPKVSTYRLTFFHSTSVSVKNIEEIEN